MNVGVSVAVALMLVGAVIVLGRRLPKQNVALIMGGLIAWEIALGAALPNSDYLWCGWLFWPAFIVLARAGIRRMLRYYKQYWNYGIWLFLLASTAAALMQFAFLLVISTWSIAVRASLVRFGSTAFCLFVLAPWFISKLPQQPHDHAQ